jgi:hypothetical protein
MEVHIEKRAVRQIRLSAADTIAEGDTEALREDILEAFPDYQIDEIEQHLGGAELAELLTQMLEEWSGDDIDELVELLEGTLGEHGVVLKLDVEEETLEADDDENDDLEPTDDDDFDGFSEVDRDDV